MAGTHYHIWLYKRDEDGIIWSMERDDGQFDTRRKANYALEIFRRQRSLAGQVLQCVDGAFCSPPPDWVVTGYTLAGPREVTAEYFIDDTPSIRPSRKLVLGMESLEKYAEDHPEDVVRRPQDEGLEGLEPGTEIQVSRPERPTAAYRRDLYRARLVIGQIRDEALASGEPVQVAGLALAAAARDEF